MPAKSLVRLMSVIIMLSVLECFLPDDDGIRFIAETAGTLLCVISIAAPLTDAVTAAVSSVALSSAFMLALIPVLGAVVSAAGNPVLAVSFQSMAFYAAQVISSVSKNIQVY